MATRTPTARDPLGDAYFTQAAQELNRHSRGSGHACGCCGGAWPCGRALAAAFVLDLHA